MEEGVSNKVLVQRAMKKTHKENAVKTTSERNLQKNNKEYEVT